MTEELVEKLTPSKEMEDRDMEERNKILEGVGEVCMAQRQYHLATKKFTQCGNRVKVSSHSYMFSLVRLILGKCLGGLSSTKLSMLRLKRVNTLG